MNVKKCDNCEKQIKKPQKMVLIGYGDFAFEAKEYCITCGKKLLSKLGQREVIKK